MIFDDLHELFKLISSNKITKPTKLGFALVIIISFFYYCCKWIAMDFPKPVTPIQYACVVLIFSFPALVFFNWQKIQHPPSKKYKSLQKKRSGK